MGDSERSEREVTDNRLGDERARSDREVERLDRHAFRADDGVIQEARKAADESLRLARASEGSENRAGVYERRREEDARIDATRSFSDEVLRGERSQRVRALEILFEAERKFTDSALRAERALADAALQARDKFLGFVAHDLRTPLTLIGLRAALLGKYSPRGEEGNLARKTGVAIQSGIRRMGMLIGDLLDAADIDSGTLRVVLSKDELTTVLSGVVEDFRPIAEERGITLVFEGVEPVPARCDRGRMAQSVGNLLSNAIKFTPPGGRILVRIFAENEKAKVSVSDTGQGIAAERLGTILDSSWETRTGDRSGLGLGLHIARHIIHAHGGKFEAQSTVGAGSTFSFTLPCTE